MTSSDFPYSRQTELKAFDRSVLYERPFVETDAVNKVPEELLGRYRACVGEIRDLGLDVKLHTLFDVETCLVHGDCHHGAVFVKDGRAAVGIHPHRRLFRTIGSEDH